MQQRPYPVVVRAASIYPHQIGSYEMHRTRSGGDLGHVDLKRSPRNRILVGDENWAAMVRQKVKEMSEFNFDLCEDKLTRRRRKKELEAHRRMGLTDPWQASKHGPMREVILTAHKDYFAGDPTKEQGFIALAQEFLVTRFGADLVHARVDLDEEACHIHAIILPVVTDQHGYQMLQPSKHPVIADYEHLQDEVGAWFAPLGLVRGERRAAARREARARGETPPPHRKHVRTSDWRRAEDARLADEHAAQQGRERGLDARTLIQTRREADLDAREKVIGGKETEITAERMRQRDKAGELDRCEAAVAEREKIVDAKEAAIEAVVGGFVRVKEDDGKLVMTAKAKNEAGAWESLHARWRAAGQQATTMAHWLLGGIETIRKEARDEARQVAREELRKDRETLQRREEEVESRLAALASVAEGFVEGVDPVSGAPRETTKTKSEPERWKRLQQGWNKAADTASEVASWALSSLTAIRSKARADGLEDARTRAMDQLLAEHPHANAVKAFAKTLIKRLPVAERDLATRDLDKAMTGQAKDIEAVRQAKTKRKDKGLER